MYTATCSRQPVGTSGGNQDASAVTCHQQSISHNMHLPGDVGLLHEMPVHGCNAMPGDGWGRQAGMHRRRQASCQGVMSVGLCPRQSQRQAPVPRTLPGLGRLRVQGIHAAQTGLQRDALPQLACLVRQAQRSLRPGPGTLGRGEGCATDWSYARPAARVKKRAPQLFQPVGGGDRAPASRQVVQGGPKRAGCPPLWGAGAHMRAHAPAQPCSAGALRGRGGAAQKRPAPGRGTCPRKTSCLGRLQAAVPAPLAGPQPLPGTVPWERPLGWQPAAAAVGCV